MITTLNRIWRHAAFQLFLVSLLSLFCEMLVIRWLSTEIRIFAYFKNLPLMAAFWGLGLGFFWSSKKSDLFKLSPLFLLYFSGLMTVAIGLGLNHLSFIDSSTIMMFGSFQGSTPLNLLYSITALVLVFILSASIFVGLGQRTGQLFDQLKPLEAYSYNIAGALAGIVLFTLLSNYQLGPGVWLIVAGLLYLLIHRHLTPIMLVALGVAYMAYLSPYFSRQLYGPDYVTTVWSPYYRIDVKRSRLAQEENSVAIGYDIFINYDSFQSMLDCTPATLAQVSESRKKEMLEFFERAFRAVPKEHPDVLILGSGTGSDVAAALRAGAAHIDAVEIDRSIYNLGKQLHPEHPYDSPKVKVHIMDARTFLKRAKNTYDIIDYALLDSHTAFSSLSSLRTDNYIFTTESFQDATKLLRPQGYIATTFICFPDWLWSRHSIDLLSGTGSMPHGYHWTTSLPTGFLIAGPTLEANTPISFSHPSRKVEIDTNIPEITDDWPFLFLPARGIPGTYIVPIFAILLVCLLPVSRSLTSGSTNLLNWQMFYLGMGFMLLEVRAIASMSLLCGATWTVNSLVIGGVMLAILIANLIAVRLPPRVAPWLVAMAIITIMLSSMVNVSDLNALPTVAANFAGTTLYLCPLFFAGALFSTLFKQTSSASQALAFNMFGGLIGITLEYCSMIFGIRGLAFIAISIYGIVMLLELLKKCRSALLL